MIRSIQIALLFLLLILPGITFLHIWPLNSLLPDGGTLLLVSVLFALTLLRSASLQEVSFSTLALLPLVMLVPFLISHLFADVVLQTTLNWTIINLVLMALLVVVAEQLRLNGMDFQSMIAKGLVIAGLVYALFALIQHYGLLAQLTGLPVPDAGRLKGAWQQPNLTTSTLWVTLFGAAYVNRNNQKLWAMLAFALLLGSALALAASRLNLLLVPFALAISGWLLWSRKKDRSAQGRQLIAGTLVISICLFIVPEVSAPVEKSLAEAGWIGEGKSVALRDRLSADRPRLVEHLKIVNSLGGWSVNEWLFGKGTGQYGTFSYQQPVIPTGNTGAHGFWLHSHNLFSMIFVEAGMLGLLTLLACVSILVCALWRQRSTEWGGMALGGLGVIFVHSMVEYPLWYPWYLALAILLATPLFRSRRLSVTSPWLFSVSAVAVLVVVSALTWNLGGQAQTILKTAFSDDDSEMSYRHLALLANDGLLGPYAVLARYRRFSPEKTNLEWQLRETQRISEWRPLDVVQLREITLLLMMGEVDQACEKTLEMVQRYPSAGPLILEKVVRIEKVGIPDVARLSICAEDALQVWGETLESMRERNRLRTNY